jgi:hypothetical protein
MVVDTAAAIQFAIDIAKGMAFIHSLDRQLPRLYLSSKHVMVSTHTCDGSTHASPRLTVSPTTSWWRG